MALSNSRFLDVVQYPFPHTDDENNVLRFVAGVVDDALERISADGLMCDRFSSRSTAKLRRRPAVEPTIDHSLWTTTRKLNGCGKGSYRRTSSGTASSRSLPVS